MSTIKSNVRRTTGDHFEPDDANDPKVQRQLRGHLEQIAYTAYAANRTVLGATLTGVGLQKFERVALATAQARARWVATGMAVGDPTRMPTPEQVAELARLRAAYEELAEVYEAMRRLVERAYVEYGAG